jgi:DNA invertase Pin-like site-specific DNA recombinase
MKRIVAYARVSTREQSENQHALEQQIDRLKDIQRSEGTQDVTILFDIGSGADPERENFQQLLTLIETDQVSTVYATRGDRLTRDYATYLKFKELTIEHEVRVKLLDEGQVDWESAAGEFSADFRALMAQDERRRIRERVSRGFQYRRKCEAACARAPFGYRTKDDKYVLHTKAIVCLISRRPHNYRELQHRVDG